MYAPSPESNPYAAPTHDGGIPSATSDPYVDGLILASPGSRLWAHFMDGLVMIPFGLLGFGLAWATEILHKSIYMGMALIYLPVLTMLAYQWYLVSTTGQTLGKGWAGIKIVKMDGTDVDFVSGVLVRSWAMAAIGLVPFLGAIAQLVNPFLVFAQDRRCLHDHLAGTQVISVY